jgi:hypothetical protein
MCLKEKWLKKVEKEGLLSIADELKKTIDHSKKANRHLEQAGYQLRNVILPLNFLALNLPISPGTGINLAFTSICILYLFSAKSALRESACRVDLFPDLQ